MNRIKGALTRKLGPLPAWAWLAMFTVAVIIYRARANNAINPVNVSDTTATPTDPAASKDPVVLQPGESVYDPGTGAVSGGAPEQVTPPNPTAPPDPVVLDPGQGVYDPGTGKFIGNPGSGDTGGGADAGGTPAGAAAAASGAKTTKITKRKGSGEKRQWQYNGHWHSVPPKDAINERRSVKTKTGKRAVQYWWGNHWHSEPMPKSKHPAMTGAGASKPTSRDGGAPRAARVNPGKPVKAPMAVMSRPRSAATMLQPLTKAGGVGTGTPPGRARDNQQAPGPSRARSVPATAPTTVIMRARPITPTTTNPQTQQTGPAHTSATPPPPVPPIVVTPPTARNVSKPPPPKGTPTKMRPR